MMGQSRANGTKLDSQSLVGLLGSWSDGSQALYVELADGLAGLIGSGALHAGDRLPAERSFSDALAVSRGTVVKAYDRLATAGSVERLQGSGTTVTGHAVPQSAEAFVSEPLWAGGDGSVSLLQAQPTLLPEVMEAVRATDLLGFGTDLDSAEPLGWWALRERIAALHTARGLPTEPQQIIVTSGAQQGISLMAGAFVRPGDVVLGEEYTWPGLIDAVQQAGARYEPIRMDHEGIDVGDLERKIIRFRPAMVLLNPQHQNPTGTRLPDHRIAEVARLAREHCVLVVEDRVAAELGFDRRRLPAVSDHDTDGLGVMITSVCKVAWPGLRLGWVRADPQIVNQLRSHKAVVDMFSSVLSQAATMTVLERFDELVEIRTTQLQRRCDIVVDALRRDFPDWSFITPRGGMWVWITLPGGVSADAFVQHAARYGVQIASARQFGAVDADNPHLRIPFTAADHELAEGMRRLAEAWRTFAGVGQLAADTRC